MGSQVTFCHTPLAREQENRCQAVCPRPPTFRKPRAQPEHRQAGPPLGCVLLASMALRVPNPSRSLRRVGD